MTSSLLEKAMDAFDAKNGEDPRIEEIGGDRIPKELLYARRMTKALFRLSPEPSEPLQLAVRAQHLGRWTIPRGNYPAGRVGYLQWRKVLGELHADLAGDILRGVGYDEEIVSRVGDLIRKRNLKSDPEAQCLEDAACLVFLEHEFPAFVDKQPEEKVITVVQKTWRKMSSHGQQLALTLTLGDRERAMVDRALRP